MKKIVTNFVATKGGNYQAQENLKNAIIKEFKLPDDWNKYMKCDIEWDKVIFYKSTFIDWKKRVAEFKLNNLNFTYSEIQRMKIIDAYMQQKNKVEQAREVNNRNKIVMEYFKHVNGITCEWQGRSYQVAMNTWNKYKLSIEMVNAKDENEFVAIQNLRYKPFLWIDIDFNFDNNTFNYEIQPMEFERVRGTINEIENQLEQMKEYALCMHNFFGCVLFDILYKKQNQLA